MILENKGSPGDKGENPGQKSTKRTDFCTIRVLTTVTVLLTHRYSKKELKNHDEQQVDQSQKQQTHAHNIAEISEILTSNDKIIHSKITEAASLKRQHLIDQQ